MAAVRSATPTETETPADRPHFTSSSSSNRTLDGDARIGRGRLGEQDRELVAAGATGEVVGAGRAVDRGADRGQELVAGAVAGVDVDGAEAVDVEQRDRERAAVALRAAARRARAARGRLAGSAATRVKASRRAALAELRLQRGDPRSRRRQLGFQIPPGSERAHLLGLSVQTETELERSACVRPARTARPAAEGEVISVTGAPMEASPATSRADSRAQPADEPSRPLPFWSTTKLELVFYNEAAGALLGRLVRGGRADDRRPVDRALRAVRRATGSRSRSRSST